MDRLFYAIGNGAQIRDASTREFKIGKLFGSGRSRWPLFYALLLTATLFVSGCMIAGNTREETQPVFFSLLFPQLMPEFMQEAEHGEAAVSDKAVML